MYEFCADRADETDVNAEATLTAGEAERGSDDDVEREWPCDWVLGSQCSNERPCKDVFESTRNVLRVCIRFSGVNCCWKRLDSTKLFGVWERDADVGGIRYIDDEWFSSSRWFPLLDKSNGFSCPIRALRRVRAPRVGPELLSTCVDKSMGNALLV